MLLSDSLVRPWPNTIPLVPRQRPPGGSFFLLPQGEIPASTSTIPQSPCMLVGRRNFLRRGAADARLSSSYPSEVGCYAFAQSVRYRSEPGVEGEDEPAEEEQEEEEWEEDEDAEASGFVEIGYISSVHGLQGDVRVKSSTAFPELRFGEPGIRWLRMQVSGNEEIRPVDLTSGRSHSGQDSWIVSFNGVTTVEEAKQLVGSTILVREDDRPELEEGEFYTPDLFGMKVLLKETGQEVGTVVNVVNYGSNDLLQVRLQESTSSLVWVPFVEAIVPDVDLDTREMLITPPKGLLELNVRSDTRSKKQRRLMEWKERKKFLANFASAKKRLAEMDQDHVLGGLTFGGKEKKNLLRRQIGNMNLKLFEHALGNVNQIERNKKSSFLYANSSSSVKNYLEVSSSCYNSSEESKVLQELKSDGLRLISESKVAVIMIPDGGKNESGFVFQVKDSLSAYRRFSEANECVSSPRFIIFSPTEDLKPCQELLSGLDDFGFDKETAWLLEEEKLPVVNNVESDYKILMSSSWEIIQSSAGFGAIFSPLSAHNLITRLNEIGVKYVQVSTLGQQCALGDPLFFGLVNTRKVNAGVKIFTEGDRDTEIDMILSMEYLNKMVKRMDELPRFYAVPTLTRHVDFDVEPEEPNSYHLYCPISHDVLCSCSSDDVAILKIVD